MTCAYLVCRLVFWPSIDIRANSGKVARFTVSCNPNFVGKGSYLNSITGQKWSMQQSPVADALCSETSWTQKHAREMPYLFPFPDFIDSTLLQHNLVLHVSTQKTFKNRRSSTHLWYSSDRSRMEFHEELWFLYKCRLHISITSWPLLTFRLIFLVIDQEKRPHVFHTDDKWEYGHSHPSVDTHLSLSASSYYPLCQMAKSPQISKLATYGLLG
jgi:hypothetical protein